MAYLLDFFVPMALFSGDPVMWIIAAVVGPCFGLMIWHSWFRSDARPSPVLSLRTTTDDRGDLPLLAAT